MAGYYGAESLLKGSTVPQFDIAAIQRAGTQIGTAFGSVMENERNNAEMLLKEKQLAQQKELAMLPYEMADKKVLAANNAITAGREQAMNANPNADKAFAELYANGTDAGNAKLFKALGSDGSMNADGSLIFDPARVEALSRMSTGTDKEIATRTRENILANSGTYGLDPITAGTLADSEYNRMYGTQATAQAAANEEASKRAFDMAKLQMEAVTNSNKNTGTNLTINNGSMGGVNGTGTGVGSETGSTVNTKNVTALLKQVSEMYTGDSATMGTKAVDLNKPLAAIMTDTDPRVNNENIIRALNIATDNGKLNALWNTDPAMNSKYDLSKPDGYQRFLDLVKSGGTGTISSSETQRTKNGGVATDADLVAQNRLNYLKDANDIVSGYDAAEKARYGQLNQSSSYDQLNDFLNPRAVAKASVYAKENLDKFDFGKDMDNIDTDSFAKVVSGIENGGSETPYTAFNKKSDGTINAAGKYQFVQSTLNDTLDTMGLPHMSLKDYMQNPELQEATFKQLTKNNAEWLRNNKMPVNPWTLWSTHNLGASQTKNFMDLEAPLTNKTKSAIYANLPDKLKKEAGSADGVTRKMYADTYAEKFSMSSANLDPTVKNPKVQSLFGAKPIEEVVTKKGEITPTVVAPVSTEEDNSGIVNRLQKLTNSGGVDKSSPLKFDNTSAEAFKNLTLPEQFNSARAAAKGAENVQTSYANKPEEGLGDMSATFIPFGAGVSKVGGEVIGAGVNGAAKTFRNEMIGSSLNRAVNSADTLVEPVRLLQSAAPEVLTAIKRMNPAQLVERIKQLRNITEPTSANLAEMSIIQKSLMGGGEQAATIASRLEALNMLNKMK